MAVSGSILYWYAIDDPCGGEMRFRLLSEFVSGAESESVVICVLYLSLGQHLAVTLYGGRR